MKSLFPMFVKLEGRRVLVLGAGSVAEQKISGLLETGARVRVVALHTTEQVREWARTGSVDLDERAYRGADLDGVFLAIVATSVRSLNEQVYREAQERRILCNVVDVPEQCDFYYASVVKRGDLQIAVSTSGQSPSLAQRIRLQLEQQFGPAYADWVSELGAVRRDILGSGLGPELKRRLLQSLASRAAFEAEVARHNSGQSSGDSA